MGPLPALQYGHTVRSERDSARPLVLCSAVRNPRMTFSHVDPRPSKGQNFCRPHPGSVAAEGAWPADKSASSLPGSDSCPSWDWKFHDMPNTPPTGNTLGKVTSLRLVYLKGREKEGECRRLAKSREPVAS